MKEKILKVTKRWITLKEEIRENVISKSLERYKEEKGYPDNHILKDYLEYYTEDLIKYLAKKFNLKD